MAFDSGSFREFAAEHFIRSTQTKKQSCSRLQGLSNGIKHINLILIFQLQKMEKSWTAKPVQRLQNLHISRALNGIKFKCDKRKVVAITDRTGMKWHHRKVQWIFLMKFHLKLSRPTEFGSRFLFQETSASWNKWPFFFYCFYLIGCRMVHHLAESWAADQGSKPINSYRPTVQSKRPHFGPMQLITCHHLRITRVWNIVFTRCTDEMVTCWWPTTLDDTAVFSRNSWLSFNGMSYIFIPFDSPETVLQKVYWTWFDWSKQ